MATEVGLEQSCDVGHKLPIAILRHDRVRWLGANSAWRTGIPRACQSALGFAFVAEPGSLGFPKIERGRGHLVGRPRKQLEAYCLKQAERRLGDLTSHRDLREQIEH